MGVALAGAQASWVTGDEVYVNDPALRAGLQDRGVGYVLAVRIDAADRFWLGIAPEGTRKPVERWKTGFWKIAHAARVPVLPVYFHYPDKVIGIGPAFTTSDDMEADLARLRDWYRPWQGRHHGTS